MLVQPEMIAVERRPAELVWFKAPQFKSWRIAEVMSRHPLGAMRLRVVGARTTWITEGSAIRPAHLPPAGAAKADLARTLAEIAIASELRGINGEISMGSLATRMKKPRISLYAALKRMNSHGHVTLRKAKMPAGSIPPGEDSPIRKERFVTTVKINPPIPEP